MLFPFAFGLGAEKAFEALPKTKKEISLSEAGKRGGAITGGILGYQRVAQEFHEPGEHYAPTITTTEPYAHYHPRLQFAPVTTYGYQGATTIIDSPGATSKKEQVMDIVSKPRADFGAIDYPTSISGSERRGEGATTGLNVTHIALIAVIGAAGIMLIKKAPTKRRKK